METDDRPVQLQCGELLRRVACLGALFALELIGITCLFDTRSLQTSGLTGLVASAGAQFLASIVAATAVFIVFLFLDSRIKLQTVSAELESSPIGWNFLAAHFLSLIGLLLLSSFLFNGHWAGSRSDGLAVLTFVVGVATAATGSFALLPPAVCLKLLRMSGVVSIWALAVGFLAFPLGIQIERLWYPSAALTLQLVKFCLRPFVPGLITNYTAHVIGTQAFNVSISKQCSGLEGAGLILLFCVFWLWLFRKECRFPQALIIIPAGIIVMWLLNVARIAILILIGNAGAPGVAMGGFHSQAGWIAFNSVAIGLTLIFPRIQWMSKRAEQALPERRTDNPVAAYLVPFLTILAAAMVCRAASGGFEWLYPLRFLAAAVALWFYRTHYLRLDWRASWFSLMIGVAVFGLWLALDAFSGAHEDHVLGSSLTALAPGARIMWLIFRISAAVITVPIAEELAFRGFLMRRIVSSNFEDVSLQAFRPVAFLVSSIAFGALHGGQWFAGTLAGMLYAFALIRRGRIGDAVLAHASTNALLALWVVAGGHWHLW